MNILFFSIVKFFPGVTKLLVILCNKYLIIIQISIYQIVGFSRDIEYDFQSNSSEIARWNGTLFFKQMELFIVFAQWESFVGFLPRHLGVKWGKTANE